jgi:hypothetical protein
LIHKFRQTIGHVFEQYEFDAFAHHLSAIKQWALEENATIDQIIESAECVLKEIVKTCQTSMAIFTRTINEKENKLREKHLKSQRAANVSESTRSTATAASENKDTLIAELTEKNQQLIKTHNEVTEDMEIEIM